MRVILPSPAIGAASDHGVLVRFADGPFDGDDEAECSAAVRGLVQRLITAALPGVLDVVPGYTTVLVRTDPRAVELAAVIEAVAAASRAQPAQEPLPPPRTVELPVCYGGEYGPDLEDVARGAGLSPDEVITLHAGARYEVGFLGFSPGFGYLRGLPKRLHTPRLATPRPAVPRGSVAIAGGQAGVYPQRGPGGWRLLGRTPLDLVRLGEVPWTRLALGDHVRFAPVSKSELTRLTSAPDLAATEPLTPPGEAAIEVLAPGLRTTVQDLGRPGWARLGISAGGAADPLALRLGNRLLGNPEGAAGLELTVRGPELRILKDTIVAAIHGGVLLDGRPAPTGQVLRLRPGQVLRCGPDLGPEGPSPSARAYLCLRGGLAVPLSCGSASTDVRGGFGGIERATGRALRRGDRLCIGPEPPEPLRDQRLSPAALSALSPRRTLRFVWGPQADWFDEETRKSLLRQPIEITPHADRTGLRLHAATPLLPIDPRRQLRTEGVTAGALQVPPDGQPILLMIEQQSSGGYPKLAHVVTADLPQLGRLRPGDTIYLEPVTLHQAQALLADEAARLRHSFESAPPAGGTR